MRGGVHMLNCTAATDWASGYIRYLRGVMTIVDRLGLEELTCECYWVVAREWDRLLGTDFLANEKRRSHAAK
jgi:hypothetical protein